VLFSYLAAHTSRIGFVPGVLVLPQRQTALVAKQAATLDIVTGGRLRLGVGVGWNNVEYEALNENFQNRGRRIVEQIKVLRLLWTQELVEYSGRWHRIDRAAVNPLPLQRPIPIWMGGQAEPVLKRVARHADGWFPQFNPAAPESIAMVERLRGYIGDAGRSLTDVGIEGRIMMLNVKRPDWRATVDAWERLGAGALTIHTTGIGLTAPQDHIAAIREFKDEIGW
jgi:probable F420-dependent oxidoreductase